MVRSTLSGNAPNRQDGLDAELAEQADGNIRARGQRLEVAFFIDPFMPRTALAENLGVKVPGTKLLFFPNEVVADAEPPAGGALHEELGRLGQRCDDVFGEIFDVEHGAGADRLGERRVPSDSR